MGDIGVKEIAGGKYAVFLYTGPYTGLGGAYKKICGEWLPGERLHAAREPLLREIPQPSRPGSGRKTENRDLYSADVIFGPYLAQFRGFAYF